MHQSRKGNQYYFGAKAHIGIDSKRGVVHSVCTSAASVRDKHMLPSLLHGEEKNVWGDAGLMSDEADWVDVQPWAQPDRKGLELLSAFIAQTLAERYGNCWSFELKGRGPKLII